MSGLTAGHRTSLDAGPRRVDLLDASARRAAKSSAISSAALASTCARCCGVKSFMNPSSVTVISFPLPRPVLAQHLVHMRLSAGAFLLVGIQHFRVQTKRLVDLAVGLRRSARSTPNCFCQTR